MTLRLSLHEAFPAEDVEAASRIASETDPDAELDATYSTKAIGPEALIIIIEYGLGPAAMGLSGAAGVAGWKVLAQLVGRLRATLRRRSQILIEPANEHVQIVLGPDSPAEALLDLPGDVREAAGEGGILVWDDEHRRWTAP